MVCVFVGFRSLSLEKFWFVGEEVYWGVGVGSCI